MIKNKSLIFIILVLALLSIGVASAQDSSSLNVADTQDSVSVGNNLETTVGEIDVSSNVSSDVENSKLQSSGEDNILTASPDSFENLQSLIDAKSNNSELVLTSDYKYNGGDNTVFTGIAIKHNNFTINGNGYTLDATNAGRIFLITGNNVTLKNLVLVNTAISDEGATILNTGYGLSIVNTTFENLTGYKDGAGIYSSGDKLTITDSTFKNIASYNDGGAVYNIGSDFNVINSTFENIAINNGGGAIWSQGDRLTILNSTFRNITANAGGAGIYTRGANVKVINSNFTNITASSQSGGAINAAGDNLLILNSTFTTNMAKSVSYQENTGGGAIYHSGGSVEVINSTFYGNVANNNGGAIYIDGANLNITNSTFKNNRADSLRNGYGGGGAIYQAGANLNVMNSTFVDNCADSIGSSHDLGGAIYQTGANLNVTDSRFTNNNDGIYHSGDNFNVLNSTFTNNKYAIYQIGDNFNVLDSTFTNNKNTIYQSGDNLNVTNSSFLSGDYAISKSGSNFNFINSSITSVYGGISMHGSNLTVSNSNFESNGAYSILTTGGDNVTVENATFDSNNDNGWSEAGAIENSCTNLTVKNSTFTSNGGYTGAIRNTGNTFTVVDCRFNDNTDITSNYAGSIYNSGDNVIIANNNFTNSYGHYGGAIYNSGYNVTVTIATFINNRAYYNGGAIWNNGEKFTVTNATFINNTASSNNGGAIYNSANDVTISNVRFINSTADDYGGAICNYGYNLTVTNATFINSTATAYNGGAIYNNADRFTLTNAIFDNSQADEYGGVIYNSGYHVILTNISSTNSKVSYTSSDSVRGGGAIYNSGYNVTVTNSSFTDTKSQGVGGAIYNNANNVNVINTIFNNSYALYNGGFVYNVASGFNIINSTFINGSSNNAGGAIYNSASGVTVTNAEFINNTVNIIKKDEDNNVYSGGGAIYNSGENFVVADSIFVNNTANVETGIKEQYYGGGAIFNYNNKFTITNSTFITNVANNQISDKYEYGGGAIVNYNGNLYISNSTFTNNSAIKGGAIYNDKSSTLDLTNNTFNGVIEGQSHIFNNGTISSPVVVTVLENKTVITALYNNITLSAIVTTVDGASVSSQILTFIVNTTEFIATSNLDGTYTFDNYTVNFNASTMEVSAKYAGVPEGKFSVMQGTLSIGNAPSNVTVNITSDIKFGEDILVNTTVAVAGEAQVSDKPSGSVTFIVKDKNGVIVKNQTLNLNQSNALYNLSGLNAGTYTIFANYNGDTIFSANSTNVTIVIPQVTGYNMSINTSDVNVGDDAIIKVILPESATGNVTISLGGKTYTGAIENGIATFTYNNLAASTYDIIAQYKGDVNYVANYTTGKITISKVSPIEYNMIVIADNVEIGEKAIIKVNLPEDIKSALVTVYVDGEEYLGKIVNGSATIQIPGLAMGEHNVTAVFDGNNKYENISNTTKFNVTEVYTYTMDINAPGIYVGEDAVITVTIPTKATGNITITLPNGTKISKEVVKGVAKFTISGLSADTYTVGVNYTGDAKYAPGYNTTDVVVSKIPIDIDPNLPDYVKILEETVINVGVQDGATGNITITISQTGIPYSGKINNGVATITLPPLGEGSYDLTISYAGDDNYLGGTVEGSFVIYKVDEYPMNITAPDAKVGEDAVINVNLPSAASGNVTVVVDGIEYSVPIVNDVATLVLDNLTAGKHTIFANYTGDNTYSPSYTIGSISISKVDDYELAINAAPIKMGEDAIIKVTAPEGADGRIVININNQDYVANIVDNVATFTVSGLANGNYTITASYDGNDRYNKKQATGDITVYESATYNMTAKAENIKLGENATITVNLPANATGSVSITLNGKSYSANISKGEAIITIPGLAAGTYSGSVIYPGDDSYAPNSAKVAFTVSKISGYDMNITIPGDIKSDENTTVIVDLPEDATGNVTVVIDGNKSIVVPVTNGSANITIPPLGPGSHDIIFNYTGDDKYDGTVVDKKITVDSNVILTTNDVVMIYKDGSRLYAFLTDKNGTPIANATVSFTINGVTNDRITDANGSASIAINLNYGVYNATITYVGVNETASVTATVTVNSSIIGNDLVKMWRNGTQFYATFLGEGAKPLANTNVTFNINGRLYTRTTDANGTAMLNINLDPGSYILTAYNPFSGEQRGFNVLVKSLIETSDLTKYYINGSRFEAKVYNYDGTFAANKTVTFNINGKFYTKTADENGTVSLAINLRPGNYIITSIYEGLSIGNSVEVLPTLQTSDLSMTYNDGSEFKVKTLDGQGNPLANQNITFNVNGVFYYKTTGDDGVASLNINLMKGEYIITSYWDEFQVGNKISIS